MSEHAGEVVDEGGEAAMAVGARVRVSLDADKESRGVVVDDFGESAGQAVDIGTSHIADPARRWAVSLDSGELVFVDSDHVQRE